MKLWVSSIGVQLTEVIIICMKILLYSITKDNPNKSSIDIFLKDSIT